MARLDFCRIYLFCDLSHKIVKNLKLQDSLEKNEERKKWLYTKFFVFYSCDSKIYYNKFCNDAYIYIYVSFSHFLRAKPIIHKFCHCLETKCLWNIHLRKQREKKKKIYICMYECVRACVCANVWRIHMSMYKCENLYFQLRMQ